MAELYRRHIARGDEKALSQIREEVVVIRTEAAKHQGRNRVCFSLSEKRFG